jgi:hypothetical protein
MATEPLDPAPATEQVPPQIGIFLVAHTNVGKTTLLRTLLGQDVGEIDDAPDVTQTTTAYDLIDDAALGALRLWDTPGFGDSFRLAQRLRQPRRWLAWGVRELWDRAFNHKLWQGQRLAIDLRARADVILYPVNLQERPFEAVYVAPEMEVLAWVGKPVVAVLNHGGVPHDAGNGAAGESERMAARVAEWRTHLSHFAVIQDVAQLDAYTRCWVQELSLFQRIGQVLPEEAQSGYLRLATALGQSYMERLDASVDAIAAYLLELARDKTELESGPFDSLKDIWSTLRKSLSLGKPHNASPLEAAMQGLAQRYAEASKTVTDQLITINRLDGTATAEIMQLANAKLVTDKPLEGGTAAVMGGVMSGVLTGLAADLMAGGLTLGTGALVGGVLGATGGAVLARGYNVSTHQEKKVVGWSADAWMEAFEKTLMLYLAVAHFGRGQGQWRAREAPAAWVNATALVVARYREQLLPVLQGSSAQPVTATGQARCAQCVRHAIRDVLLEVHPEASALPLEKASQTPLLQVLAAELAAPDSGPSSQA